MNARIKALWLAELRNENNRQGQGKLRVDVPGGGSKFCCLGLLCEIAVREGVIDAPIPIDHSAIGGGIFYDYHQPTQLLPDVVYEWAELTDTDPDVRVPSEEEPGFMDTRTLSVLNDTGWSFERIAEIIEEQL